METTNVETLARIDRRFWLIIGFLVLMAIGALVGEFRETLMNGSTL